MSLFSPSTSDLEILLCCLALAVWIPSGQGKGISSGDHRTESPAAISPMPGLEGKASLRGSSDDMRKNIGEAAETIFELRVTVLLAMVVMLIIPTFTARLLMESFVGMALTTVACGGVSLLVGLAASQQFNIPQWMAILLTQATIFLLSLAWTKLKS